ncbi:hypothetical protein BU16DRAFT_527915 [Lophium mytilinum]|uniref:CBM1 domain-containing protein n=1 Tax=Lophium mytilinum TaxID=390894 RepID=A0A6A6QMS1_9PEZI|nr:hypothetical protein BU16DRAFT_527915 [Lophium mytilinum]
MRTPITLAAAFVMALIWTTVLSQTTSVTSLFIPDYAIDAPSLASVVTSHDSTIVYDMSSSRLTFGPGFVEIHYTEEPVFSQSIYCDTRSVTEADCTLSFGGTDYPTTESEYPLTLSFGADPLANRAVTITAGLEKLGMKTVTTSWKKLGMGSSATPAPFPTAPSSLPTSTPACAGFLKCGIACCRDGYYCQDVYKNKCDLLPSFTWLQFSTTTQTASSPTHDGKISSTLASPALSKLSSNLNATAELTTILRTESNTPPTETHLRLTTSTAQGLSSMPATVTHVLGAGGRHFTIAVPAAGIAGLLLAALVF